MGGYVPVRRQLRARKAWWEVPMAPENCKKKNNIRHEPNL